MQLGGRHDMYYNDTFMLVLTRLRIFNKLFETNEAYSYIIYSTDKLDIEHTGCWMSIISLVFKLLHDQVMT